MTFRAETRVNEGRKPHRCDYCYGTIPKGWPSIIIAQVWDGEFSTCRGHIDCVDLWNTVFLDFGDVNDGMPIYLMEAIAGDEARETVQAEYDFYRGHYPHVICRLELRWQRGDLKGQARYRDLGIAADPEDYPEVYG